MELYLLFNLFKKSRIGKHEYYIKYGVETMEKQ